MNQQERYAQWADKQELKGRPLPQEEPMTGHPPGTTGYWAHKLSQYPADTRVQFIGGAIILTDPATGGPAKPYDAEQPPQ